MIRGGRPVRQLAGIDRLFHEQSRIALVTTPEDLAVTETLETIEALHEAGFPATPWIVANRVRPPAFPRGTKAAGMRLTAASLARTIAGAGGKADEDAAGALLAAAKEEEGRTEAERRQLRRLRSPSVDAELPLLATASFGRDEVERLAGELAEAVS
jgi:hypothetical protein